jgi:hypothetical protein
MDEVTVPIRNRQILPEGIAVSKRSYPSGMMLALLVFSSGLRAQPPAFEVASVKLHVSTGRLSSGVVGVLGAVPEEP